VRRSERASRRWGNDGSGGDSIGQCSTRVKAAATDFADGQSATVLPRFDAPSWIRTSGLSLRMNKIVVRFWGVRSSVTGLLTAEE